jgi:F420-dependent oxidoreductase-like protein
MRLGRAATVGERNPASSATVPVTAFPGHAGVITPPLVASVSVYDLSQLRIFTEPQQGATYDDLLCVARRAEELGFGAFFRSDHYLAMGDALAAGGVPGPTDAWITLAGLARDTSTIRLGTLVTAATFRSPGVLALSVANVDHMSAGRVELGLGAGWYEQEHTAYGIPFPELGERFDRLEEQLQIVTGMWSTPTGQHFDFVGDHYRLTDSPALPKPIQDEGIPIIIGGNGRRRTPGLAARFASEFNLGFRSVADFTAQRQRVIDACSVVGRDPASMTFSAALVVAVGRDEDEFIRRASAIGREPDELRKDGIAGVRDDVAVALQRWQDAGADRIYLQVLDLADLDHLDTIAAASVV